MPLTAQTSPGRPAKCPACGSERIAALLYDFPTRTQQQAELQTRRARLAARKPTGNAPRWCCLKCRFEWGHPRGLSGSSAGSDDLA